VLRVRSSDGESRHDRVYTTPSLLYFFEYDLTFRFRASSKPLRDAIALSRAGVIDADEDLEIGFRGESSSKGRRSDWRWKTSRTAYS